MYLAVRIQISDLAGLQTRSVKLPAKAGVQRYRWDLKFDPKPYTPEQRQYLDNLFQDLLARYPMNALTTAYNNFKRNSDPAAQRRIVDGLRTGVLSLPLSDEYGLPTAKAGTYLLKLRRGAQEWRQTLQIREDPME